MTTKYYVGVKKDGVTKEVWSASCHIVIGWKGTPAWKKQDPLLSKQYVGIIGPFKTKAGAEYMAKYAENDSTIWSCADADAKATAIRKGKPVKKSRRELELKKCVDCGRFITEYGFMEVGAKRCPTCSRKLIKTIAHKHGVAYWY